MHQLNVRAIITRLNAKPFMRVQSGAFVGRFEGQEYELGSTRREGAGWPRQVLDVRDANAHLFQFVTAAGSGYLVFGYTVAGASSVYLVPTGTEEAMSATASP